MPRVLVSAGHTVMDPGDVYGDLREADLTREIANLLIPHLKKKGYIVMAVPLDLPLLQRIEWINNTGYRESLNDICIEIHINSGGKRGLEGWYKEEGNNKSETLAKTLVSSVSKQTGYQSQGAHSEYDHDLGALAFLNRTNPVTAILECLYIDNDADVKILKDKKKLDRLAAAIADAVSGYFGDKDKSKEKSTGKPDDDNKQNEQQNNNKQDTQPEAEAKPKPKPGPEPQVGTQHETKSAPVRKTPPISSRPMSGGLGSKFGGGNKLGGATGAGGNMMQDREQRKEMIQKRYVQILGREPSQSDLNYFLNTGVTEDQLIKRMVESQEHVDLVKAKQELANVKEELQQTKSDLVKFRAKATENDQIVTSMNQLLAEKNQQIGILNQSMAAAGVMVDPNSYATAPVPQPQPQVPPQQQMPAAPIAPMPGNYPTMPQPPVDSSSLAGQYLQSSPSTKGKSIFKRVTDFIQGE